MRTNHVFTDSDKAGDYEVELIEVNDPKSIVICSHGNGVRRWDGERFFHNVAEHYPTHSFYLVDQNQVIDDGCSLNDLSVMAARVQELITLAKQNHPSTPIIVLAHSMGCGVATRLGLTDVERVIFVAPAAGDLIQKLAERYGKSIAEQGGMTHTSDGLNKLVTKEYIESVKGLVWEEEYEKLLKSYPEVYVFESGEEEIVADERFKHRNLPFKNYKIIPGAKHNYAGEALKELFTELDTLL